MTTKEIKYVDAIRAEHRRSNNRQRRKQPFPKIYSNTAEDYQLYETDEDQIKAVMVDIGNSENIYQYDN